MTGPADLTRMRAMGRIRPRSLALALLLAACGTRGTTAFPPGINALQDNIAVAWPSCPPLTGASNDCAAVDDPYPQTMATETSTSDPAAPSTTIVLKSPLTGSPTGDETYDFGTAAGYGWAHGRGYLKYPIAQIWAVLQLPGVIQLSFYPERNQSSCDAAMNVESGYEVSFDTHEVPDGVIQSHYDFIVTFREGVMVGTEAAPQQIGVVYQKTWGAISPGVQVLVGSIIFEAVPGDPNVTSIELIRHLQATDTDGGPQALRWITDYYDEIASVLGGTPAPALCTLDN